MAAIRNSISLQDNMSPVFRSIITAMNSTLNVMKKVDAQSARGAQSKAYRAAERDIKRANTELQRMQNNLKRVDKEATRATSTFATMRGAVGGVSFNLINFSAALYMIRLIGNAIGGLAAQADSARSAMAQFGMFGNSDRSNFDIYGSAYAIANQTRTPLEDTADLVNRLLVSRVFAPENDVSSALNMTRLINQAYIAGGRTAEENQRSLRQLMQGISSGIFQGDELRSVREQTAYIADIIARGLGKIDERFAGSTGGDLKAIGATGELTSKKVIEAFMAMSDEIQANFAQMPKTFSQATTVMGNTWQMFIAMLAQDGGPLARVNALLWEIADFMQTDSGNKFLSGIASGLSAVVNGLTYLWRITRTVVQFIQDNLSVIQSMLMVLASVVMVKLIAGVANLFLYIVKNPILLVILGVVAAFGLLTAAINNLTGQSYSLFEVIGGSVEVVKQTILNVFNFLDSIWNGFRMGVLMGGAKIIGWIMDGFYAVVGVAELAVDLIVAGLISAAAILQYVFSAVGNKLSDLWAGIVSLVGDAAVAIIGIVAKMAQAIDSVFGTNFGNGVLTFQTKVDNMFTDKVTEMHNNNAAKFAEATDIFNNRLDAAKEGLFSNWGLSRAGTTSPYVNSLFDIKTPTAAADANRLLREGPVDNSIRGAWSRGVEAGGGFLNNTFDTSALTQGISVLESIYADGVTVNDGQLDSIGSIKSDVNLKEEDIKMLRDVSAREYLLQMQQVTPTANISFGDVRETADVYKIMDAIEEMIENQMASMLVTTGRDGYITDY